MPHKRFVIHVTQTDIQNGLRNNSYHCAVSQAIARELPDAKFISTDIQTIRFSLAESGIRYVYLTPPRVQQYVIAFDAGDDLEEFTFSLNYPAWQHSRWPSRAADSNPTKPRPGDQATYFRVKEEDGTRFIQSASQRSAPVLRGTSRRVYGLRALRVNQPDME